MNDVYYRVIDLPPGIHGFVMEDPDGNFNVYLNARDSQERRLHTAEHERAHILLGHLRDSRPVSELEREAEAVARNRGPSNVEISTILPRRPKIADLSDFF